MTIPANQIVVVTGDPRSGTSLMMQSLKLLGVPGAGDEYLQHLQEKLHDKDRGWLK